MPAAAPIVTARRHVEELAAVLSSIDAAASDPARLDDLLDTIACLDRVFSGAILLKSGSRGRSFVVAGARGCQSREGRPWQRWPLRRLFTGMKPTVIADPLHDGSSALALPFDYEAGQFVVWAPLAAPDRAGTPQAFFAALESITIPSPIMVPPIPDEIPVTPAEPAIVGFALCDALFDRVRTTLQRRGWPISRVRTFGVLCRRLQEPAPDVVAVDVGELANPVSGIASIHRVSHSDSLRVLAFDSQSDSHAALSPWIDRLLPHEADSEATFKALKELARDASTLRRVALHRADAAATKLARSPLTPQQLADDGAERAAEIVRGWATVVLVSERGALYRAERPCSDRKVLSSIPKSFLADSPRFEVRADEQFLAEIAEDPDDLRALRDLRPLSGASVPLALSGRPVGVLVALSQARCAESATFEALHRFAGAIARQFGDLSTGPVIPEFSQERSWEQLSDGSLALDIYRSSECATAWHYRTLDESSGLLTLGFDDDSGISSESSLVECVSAVSPGFNRFAGVIDFASHSMSYASRGFSPPLSLSRQGPVGTVRAAGRTLAGVTTLTNYRAVICDGALWRWVRERSPSIETLRQLLDEESPPGLASIVTVRS